MNKNIINATIGSQLKSARKLKGWSLDTASQFTHVSKAMLGQIERGESSPTVAKLWDIANGFEYPLSYFLGEAATHNTAQTTLASEQGISITTLFPFNSETRLEVFSLCLSAEHQHMSTPHNKGVIEHILVIEGEMEYFYHDKWHKLATGESARFTANKTHGYRNPSKKPAIFHNIICYTEQNSK